MFTGGNSEFPKVGIVSVLVLPSITTWDFDYQLWTSLSLARVFARQKEFADSRKKSAESESQKFPSCYAWIASKSFVGARVSHVSNPSGKMSML